MSEQKGAFRVNCIDCLDRTNVVEVRCNMWPARSSREILTTSAQSAFARHVLNRQLGSVALQYPSGTAKAETDVIFNDGKHYGKEFAA